MKCLKCNYIFSEEIKICPKCGADMGFVLEKLGHFPPPALKPFLTMEDFHKETIFTEPEKIEEEKEEKEIEFFYKPGEE